MEQSTVPKLCVQGYQGAERARRCCLPAVTNPGQLLPPASTTPFSPLSNQQVTVDRQFLDTEIPVLYFLS